MKDKERITFDRIIEDLKREAGHAEKERQLEKGYREKEHALKVQEAVLNKDRDYLIKEKELAKAQAKATELENRITESPYKQLEALLKALLVKMPTLNIQELSVSAKEKK